MSSLFNLILIEMTANTCLLMLIEEYVTSIHFTGQIMGDFIALIAHIFSEKTHNLEDQFVWIKVILGFYFNLYNLGEKFKMFTVSLYGGIFNSNCKIEHSTFLFLNCQTSLYVTYFSYTVVPLKAEKGLFLWNNSWLSISLGFLGSASASLWFVNMFWAFRCLNLYFSLSRSI